MGEHPGVLSANAFRISRSPSTTNPAPSNWKPGASLPRDTLLGLYEGVPLDRRGWYYQMALPDRITLFQGPLERHAGGESPSGDLRDPVA